VCRSRAQVSARPFSSGNTRERPLHVSATDLEQRQGLVRAGQSGVECARGKAGGSAGAPAPSSVKCAALRGICALEIAQFSLGFAAHALDVGEPRLVCRLKTRRTARR